MLDVFIGGDSFTWQLLLQCGKQVNILGATINVPNLRFTAIFESAVLRAVELRHGGGSHHRQEDQDSFLAHKTYNSWDFQARLAVQMGHTSELPQEASVVSEISSSDSRVVGVVHIR